MNPWLVVAAIWLGVFALVIVVGRMAEARARQREEDSESLDGIYAQGAAWRELDTENARRGAGHPLQ
jgi:hypothetical protein